jgi:hypothetical protein
VRYRRYLDWPDTTQWIFLAARIASSPQIDYKRRGSHSYPALLGLRYSPSIAPVGHRATILLRGRRLILYPGPLPSSYLQVVRSPANGSLWASSTSRTYPHRPESLHRTFHIQPKFHNPECETINIVSPQQHRVTCCSPTAAGIHKGRVDVQQDTDSPQCRGIPEEWRHFWRTGSGRRQESAGHW